jgi:hypothetical protein
MDYQELLGRKQTTQKNTKLAKTEYSVEINDSSNTENNIYNIEKGDINFQENARTSKSTEQN